jgi:hypothetical protein
MRLQVCELRFREGCTELWELEHVSLHEIATRRDFTGDARS